MNLLIVEDQQPLLASVIAMASRLGHRVLRASGPDEAVDMMREWHGHVQVVLVDWSITMHLSGALLFAELRALSPDVALVVMSLFPEEEVRRALPEGLLVHYLRKPFLNFELETALQNAKLRR